MNNNQFNFFIYLLALFLLVSAPSIALILLIIILFLNLSVIFDNLRNFKWNYLILISSILLLISSFEKFLNADSILNGVDPFLTLISLFNWIPLFLIFLISKSFLDCDYKRNMTMKALCFGTVPLLISGFGQYFFNWHGPFSALKGMIVWYQRPILGEIGQFANGIDGLTGLFNNANTAGDWLVTILPMCVYFFIQKKQNIYEKTFFLILTLSSILSIILTNSRSSIAILSGIFVTFLKIKFILITLLFFLIFILTINLFSLSLNQAFFGLFELDFINNQIKHFSNYPRLKIWNTSISFISKRPLLGFGASVFPAILIINSIGNYRHSHNIFFELALIFGAPCAISIFLIIFNIFRKTLHKSKYFYSIKKGINTSRDAWIYSSIIILLSQMVDLTYYDLRISIIFWILLAGLDEIGKRDYDFE